MYEDEFVKLTILTKLLTIYTREKVETLLRQCCEIESHPKRSTQYLEWNLKDNKYVSYIKFERQSINKGGKL